MHHNVPLLMSSISVETWEMHATLCSKTFGQAGAGPGNLQAVHHATRVVDAACLPAFRCCSRRCPPYPCHLAVSPSLRLLSPMHCNGQGSGFGAAWCETALMDCAGCAIGRNVIPSVLKAQQLLCASSSPPGHLGPMLILTCRWRNRYIACGEGLNLEVVRLVRSEEPCLPPVPMLYGMSSAG